MNHFMLMTKRWLWPQIILIMIFVLGVLSFIAAMTNLMLILTQQFNGMVNFLRIGFLLGLAITLFSICYKKSHDYAETTDY